MGRDILGDGECVPLNNWSGVVNRIFVSTLSRLFCVCGSCWGTYSFPQTLLLDFSGSLSGEKAAWRGQKGRKEKNKKWSGLSPSKNIPEGTHVSIYY